MTPVEKSPRDHTRTAKPRQCRGCGEMMPEYILHGHEATCRREHVQPGDRFRIIAATIRDGKRHRRPIEVEIVGPHGEKGFIVRSLVSGNLIVLTSIRRLLDWENFEPGLTRTRKRMERAS